MRWIKRLSLIFLVTLLLLMLGVTFTLSQKLEQAGITNLSGSIGHLDFTSLELEHLSATYQSQSQTQSQHIELENVLVQWTDMNTWFHPTFEITTFSIENAQLQLSSNTLSKDQAPIAAEPSHVAWHKILADWQTRPFVSDRFAWLGLLPKTTEIKLFSISRDCPAGLCRLTGQISASLENRSPSSQTQKDQHGQQNASFQASLQGSLTNPDSPENALSFLMKVALNAENLPTLQLQLSLDDTLNFILNNHLTAENQLASTLSLSGIAPNPIWFNTLEEWSGFSLSEAAQLQIEQQALTPVKIEASNRMPLGSIDLLVQHLLAQQLTAPLSKTENCQSAEEPPITMVPERLLKLSTQLEMNIELPKPTPIPAIGMLQGLLNAKLSIHQGVLQDYQLQTSGTLSKHSITETLQTIKFIKGLEVDEIAFDLKSQSDSPETPLTSLASLATVTSLANTADTADTANADKLTNITKLPFELSVHTVTSSPHKNQFRLFSQGELTIETEPELVLYNGLLSLRQPSLKMLTSDSDAGKTEYRFNQLKADIPFTASYHDKTLLFKIDKADIKGDLYVIESGQSRLPMVKLNKSSLQLDTFAFNLKHDTTNLLNWSLSSQQAILKTQLSSPQLNAKDVQISLNALQLNSPNSRKTSPPLHIKTSYSVTTPRLEQSQLRPQFWAAKGYVSGDLSNLTLSGRVSNAAELNLQHKSRWKNKTLSSDWTLEPLFFLAGNPMKKTFTSWPKELTLASGQLALKGQVKFNTKAFKDPLAALSGTLNTEMKHISGLYQQTAFSQISASTALNLSNQKFKVSLPSLEITQINHGLIAGPIQMSGQYQSVLTDPLKGLLKIEKLQSGLFHGQAWLAPQTIDLSEAFKTELHLKDVDIEELLKQHPTGDLIGKGLIDGVLPLEINLTSEPPTFLIQQGEVSSQSSGGLLKYQPATKSAMGKSNQSMQLVLDVLDDFHYTLLQSSVSIGADKKLILGLTLKGRNPSLEKGRAVNLNINLEEDLPSLITSMQMTNQVSETIKRRVQEKIQQKTNPVK